MTPRSRLTLALIVWAGTSFRAAPTDARILFTLGTAVPRAVQEFAWQTIEARCHSQQYQLWERSFWAYDARARRVDGAVVYTLKILSEVPWQKSEPPAFIEMTIVDDGGVRLTALHSVFVTCAP